MSLRISSISSRGTFSLFSRWATRLPALPAKHAFDQVSRGALLELVLLHQRRKDERAVLGLVRHRPFFLQAAQQGLHGAVRDRFAFVERVGDFAGGRPLAFPEHLHDLQLYASKLRGCHERTFFRAIPERRVVYGCKSS